MVRRVSPYRCPYFQPALRGVGPSTGRQCLTCFLVGAWGIRRGEMGALVWMDCNFSKGVFHIRHSYYWRRGGASERHEDGRLGEASAHAAGIEECTARVENAELLSAECGFRVSVTSSEGTKAARSRGGTQPQDQAGIRQVWHPRSGLAYLSAHGRKHAGRDGRTPTHHPRLSAPQPSERDPQIFAGHPRDQAVGAGQTGRRTLAYRVVVAEQNPTHSIILPRATRAIESVALQAFPDVNLELWLSFGPR